MTPPLHPSPLNLRIPRTVLAGVFFTSMSMLLQELMLTRVFSVTMFYHFAFMVVSIALFGIGVSGIYIYLNSNKFPAEKADAQMTGAATIYAVSVLVCFLLQHALPASPESPRYGALFLALTYVIIAIPFFFGGMTISVALTHYSRGVSTLYFSDLVGASIGCALVFPGLSILTGPDMVIVASLLGGLGAVAFAIRAGRNARTRAGVVLAGLAALLALNATGTFVIATVEPGRPLRPDTKQPLTPLDMRWNPMSRVTLYEGSTRPAHHPGQPADSIFYPEDQMLMLIDKSAMTWAVGFDGDWKKVDWIFSDVSALPLFLHPGAKVLDIGSGGGQHALTAIGLGSRDVTCVEINPTVVRWTKNRFDERTGHIYNRPEVRVFVGDGRTFAARSKETYDVISFVSATTFTATASGAFMMAENNLFTTEAFDAYYDHLAPDGMIGVSQVMTRDYPGLMLRVTGLGRNMLERHGITDAANHIIVATKRTGGYGISVIKKSPFTEAEIDRADSLAAVMGWDILHSPRTNAHPQFHQILTEPDLHAFTASLPLNLYPPTDDKPFFFNLVPFSRLNTTQTGGFDVKYGKGPARILIRLFWIVLVLTVLFLIVPLILARRARLDLRPGTAATLGFFTTIGLGFIMIEVPLMQRFVLYLGHPVYATAVILFSILLFSGVGSLTTRAVTGSGARGWLMKSLPALLALAFVYNATLEKVFTLTQDRSEPVKIAISIGLLLPLGLLMGMPFPAMLRRVSAWSPGMVPWCWSVNGAASVLGSVAGVVVALSLGFGASLWIGAAAYVAAVACVAALPKFAET